MQDIGLGGSWLISIDCVVWFFGVQYLLGDKFFVVDVYKVFGDMLVQDCQYVFDMKFGLYCGEIFFMDWCEQSYLVWIFDEVIFIGQLFVLFINVLYYQVLQMVVMQVCQYGDIMVVVGYVEQVKVLKVVINVYFWCVDCGMYMSFFGGDSMFNDIYDLFGIVLVIISGVVDGDCVL